MNLALIGLDLLAILVLVFALFLPRHGRRDLVVAYLGVNVGVLAVASALSATTVGAGLGLGLFGVLSIIRLRSEELTASEVAYYFAALALGLLGGLGGGRPVLVGALMLLVLGVLGLGDSPVVARPTRRQELLLDRAHLHPAGARAHVERLLGSELSDLTIIKSDLVNDTTLVTARVRVSPSTPRAASPHGHDLSTQQATR